MPRFHRQVASLSLVLMVTSLVSAYPPFASILALDVPLLIPNANAVSRNIALDGAFFGWNSTTNPNPTIAVANGDTITLSLHSVDVLHQFYIDINGNGTQQCPQEKCSPNFPPDASFPFAVDFAPGTYTYYCLYHQTTMRGSFVVQGFTITSSPSSLRIVQGSSNTSTITVTSVNNFAGTVDLSTPVSPSGPMAVPNPTSVTLSPNGTQTSILTVSASGTTPVGNYNVNVTGLSGSVSGNRIVPALVVTPDFGISAGPTRLVIPLGSSRNSTITISSLDSFSGNVALSTNPLPPGMAATLTPTSVTVPSGGRANSTLDVSVSPTFTMPGTYIVNVTGTSGPLTHKTTVTVVAGPDFDIATNPDTLAVTPGSSGTSTLTLASFNSFAGTVDLAGPVPPGGLTFSITPPSIALSGDGIATAMLAISAPTTTVAADYVVTVNATSGGVRHASTVRVSVIDFSVTVSNASLTVQQGSSATTTVSITSLNRFAGVVNLTTASTGSLSRLLNVTTLTLGPSGTVFAILTIHAASVQAGTYTVSITGTSGSLVRTVSFSITVQPSPGGAIILPLIGGATATIAVATGGFYFARRRRLRKKMPGGQIPT